MSPDHLMYKYQSMKKQRVVNSLLRIREWASRNPLKFFGIVSLVFITWQGLILVNHRTISRDYCRKDATGLAYTYASKFVFFYYRLGLFPVVSDREPQTGSKEEAIKILNEGGDNLLMEYYHWSRLGNSGRIFMFLPDAFLFGKIKNPSVRTFNGLFFIGSLLLVFWAFLKQRRILMGFCYLLFVGSSAFWLHEVYLRDNLFSLLIINFNILFALFAGIIFQKSHDRIYLKLLLAGICIAFFASMRSEVKSMMLSCMLVILLYNQTGIFKKIQWIFFLLGIFILSNAALNKYFDYKFKEAHAAVKQHHGIPYDGPRIESHKLWHPIFVFLGDFDTQYGYGPKVNDTVAYAYAVPILNEKYGMNLKYSGKLYLDEYYDSTHKYYKKFDEIPEYEEICKQKVLHDIKNDPIWFLKIIGKRILMNFTSLSPISIRPVLFDLPIPFSGFFILLLIPLLLYFKNYGYLNILLFCLPISLASVMIYAKDNITYNHIYHIFTLIILIQIIVSKFLLKNSKV